MRISLILLVFAGLSCLASSSKDSENGSYLSPTHITCDKNSGKAYVSLSTAAKIAVIDIPGNRFEEYINLPFDPGETAICMNSQSLIVADKCPEGRVHLVSLLDGKTYESIKVGHTPDALAITPDGQRIFVANRFSNNVSVIDLVKKEVIKNIPVERDPKAIAISPDGQYIAVANNIPESASTDQFISAKVSLIDAGSLKNIKNIPLANGSQSIEDVIFSADGSFLYASHILSRNTLPTTQVERGWINSNAVSIIDVGKKDYITTILLDNFNRGAANPAGMDISDDGIQLYVALAGVHELCIIDLPELHNKLKNTTHSLDEIPNDFRFLLGIKNRIPIMGKSPRHLGIYQDKILVGSYFSSGLEILSRDDYSESIQVSMGDEPVQSSERRGELLFCDADLCFQKWQSCISCHPEARVDGLNWDLLNDGAGNPKNGKSMLFGHFTPPAMVTGIRNSAEVAVRAGLNYILFTDYEESDAQDIDAYLKSLKPVPSPYLKNGKLSKNARKGKRIFFQADCIKCHTGEYHTDGKKYNVGTGIHPHENDEFDVPLLSEIWRTAPYLYDGRAKTMKEVFIEFNPEDKHGITSGLSEIELNQLVEYVLSL